MENARSLAKRIGLPFLVALALTGCGGGKGKGTVVVSTGSSATIVPTAPAPTPTPTPSPTPMAMPAPAGGTVLSPTLAGIDPIKSGINVQDYLIKAWGSGDIPGSNPAEGEGAFRFLCAPSHNAYDDPIVYPGQPGKSHLHTFFGNTKADANSTYASLRTSGESTCNALLNRSAYWIPAMMNGRGKVVMPDYVSIYYKRMPKSDPNCQRMGKECIGIPRGLRYIFGYNMSDPSKSSSFYFNCEGAGATQGWYKNIPEAAKNCPSGARLGVVLSAPSCWNGTELDTPDHRSHMAYPSYGDWGYPKCPSTHPYVIPTFTLGAWYTTDDTLDRTGNEATDLKSWYFVSDRMPGMPAMVSGTSAHTDWFGAWEDSVLDSWIANCIDKNLSCSGGDLGNGWQITTTEGYKYGTKTVTVDPPAKS